MLKINKQTQKYYLNNMKGSILGRFHNQLNVNAQRGQWKVKVNTSNPRLLESHCSGFTLEPKPSPAWVSFLTINP